MPSTSEAQARLMRAVANGWKKPGGGGPSVSVAKEFVAADKTQAALRTARKYANGGAVDTNPSEAQKEAGNYKKAHISFQGLPISIENPKGSMRSGVGKDGKVWSVKMPDHYGYIKRTEGADGDHVDVYVGPDANSNKVFIIDQVHDDSKEFDEHKAMLGYRNQDDAVEAYRKAFSDGKGHLRIGEVTPMNIDAFKSWLKGDGGKKPVGMFRGGKVGYADGGDVPDEWESVPKSPEGRPQITVTKPPTPGELVSTYARKAADWFGQPSPIKPETPPQQEFNASPDIGAAVRGVGSGMIQHYKDLADPFTKDEEGKYLAEQPIPETPGKIPEVQKDPISRSAPILGEVASTFAGSPGTGVGWGLLKGAATGIAGMAAKAGAKSAVRQGFMDTAHFKSVGLSKGTMPGGFKVDPATGTEWYVKQAPNLEQAKNEKLTAELYKLFGVPVADVHLTTVGGKPGIASKKIEGSQLGHATSDYAQVPELHENFPIHALLANHDAVGTGPENPLGNIIIDKTGKAHVIDTGGGLLYKGTGSKKAKFTPEVDELDTMKDPEYSHLSAEVFGGVDHQAAMVGAQKIANVKGEDIAKLIELYGPPGKMEKLQLLSTLLKRKHNIETEFGVVPGQSTAYTAPKSVEPARPAIDEYQQIPFTEDDYAKWEKEATPPPMPDDVAVPRPAKDAISDKWKDTPAAQWLMSGEKIDKSALSAVAKNLTNGSAWDTAHHLWEIADSVNPQTAEALFRALPPKIQVDVGHRIAALKDSLEYSPFNSIAKGSGKDGKYPSEYDFYTTQTTSFKPPASVLKDKKFIDELDSYAAKIEGKEPEIPAQIGAKGYEPIPGGYASQSLNAPKEANKLMEHFKTGPNGMVDDYDVKGIGTEIAKLYQAYPNYADKVYSNTPSHLHGAIAYHYGEAKKELEAIKAADEAKKVATGDFTFQQGRSAANNEKNSPIGIAFASKYLEPIKDFRNWTPGGQWNPPAFKNAFQRKLAELRGFNSNFEIYKGGDIYNPHPEDKSYPKYIDDPSTKSYEPGWFAAKEKWASDKYGQVGGSYIMRADKASTIDFADYAGHADWNPTAVHNAILAAKKRGDQLLIIKNMMDPTSGLHDQYVILNTAILRGPNAKFAIKDLHKSWPLAGVAGGGLFTYGAQEKDKMNRGGIPGLMHRVKMATGGSIHPRHPAGMIKSSIPGRTDKIPMSVPPGSYILPADIPSALGQGNTMAGEKILGTMFKSGPASPGSTGQLSGGKLKPARPPHMARLRLGKFADGGATEDIPIIAAGGEVVLHPDQVREIGHGDLEAGHRVLDKFVVGVRKQNIETLKKLKPPKV